LNNTNASKLQENMESQTNSKSPEENALEQQQQNQQEAEAKAKKKRRRNIIIGVVVVVAIVGGIFAYKKGLFGKKASV
jgi:cobalamin biosynthesis Mg chelatase CobN